MLNTLYFDKESILKPVKFKELRTDLDYDVTDDQKKGFIVIWFKLKRTKV